MRSNSTRRDGGRSRLARCTRCDELDLKTAMVDGLCSTCAGQMSLPLRDRSGRFINLTRKPDSTGGEDL
jgi:hypothetical protein